MELNTLMAITLIGMLVAILAGVHIALALGITALVGTYFIFEDWYLASAQVGGAAYELVRHYVFATIPLFVLMGDFVAKCGAAGDLYKVINRVLGKIPGRLAVATVTGNAGLRGGHGNLHRVRRRVQPDRLSGNDEVQVQTGIRARLHRRFGLSRHADPAQRAADRVGHHHRAIHRQAVRGGGDTGNNPVGALRRLHGRGGDREARPRARGIGRRGGTAHQRRDRVHGRGGAADRPRPRRYLGRRLHRDRSRRDRRAERDDTGDRERAPLAGHYPRRSSMPGARRRRL